jgi:hypothetical protein
MTIEIEMVPAEYNYLFEDREPEGFCPEIKRPAGDFFTYEEIIEFFEISPANLVSCLRQLRDIIKIYSPTLNRQDRELFYDPSIDPVECLYIFHDARFHYVEVRAFRRAWLAEAIALSERDAQLVKAQKEAADIHLWNTHLNEQNQELRSELAASKGEAEPGAAATARTQAATETRQGKVLEAWQAAFKKIMVPVILQCHADGPKKRTRAELQSMCSKHGDKLSDT